MKTSVKIISNGLIGLALASLCVLSWAGDGTPLMFGVLNQQSPAKTAQRWNPILKYLGEVTGLQFQLRMGATVQETDAMMGRGEFDLVFTNHNFRKEFDGTYKVIARWAGEPIYGVIAVPPDSPARSIRDLKGKRIAFPSKEAFVAYAVPVAALAKAGVNFTPVMTNNQDGALAQLKVRQVDAAAVNSRFLAQYVAQQGISFREIFISEGYAELPVIVHPRLPKGQVDAIRKALVGMKDNPRAVAALQAAEFSGFEPASERDYDNVRKVYRGIQE